MKRDIEKDRARFCGYGGFVSSEIVEHYIERAEAAEKRVKELEGFVEDVIPMAMWVSCKYHNHEEADPTTHCCEWTDLVERSKELLGRDEPCK